MEELLDYICENHGTGRAELVLARILHSFELLAETPFLGHTRTDLTEEKVLFWPVCGCLVVYRPEACPVEIVRVVSGRRDVKTLLEDL